MTGWNTCYSQITIYGHDIKESLYSYPKIPYLALPTRSDFFTTTLNNS